MRVIDDDISGMTAQDIDQAIALLEKTNTFPDREIRRLQSRQYILEGLPKDSTGAEIGVFRGNFAEVICEKVKPRKIYLIDPWTLQGEVFPWGKGKYVSFGNLTTQAARDESRLRTARHPHIETVMIEGHFPQCAALISDRLDWAYVDTSHKYEQTLTELRALSRQVKPGGVIMGDDWQPDPLKPHFGVFQAVQQFVEETDWCVVACGPARQWALRRFPEI